MNQFTGHDLKRQREAKNITLQQAAQDTCLRAGFLEELENNDDSAVESDVYSRLSKRMYAQYLGLDTPMERNSSLPDSKINFLAPINTFIRRLSSPSDLIRKKNSQRNSILNLVKFTSAGIVVILAVGLWTLNAKLSRLNFSDSPRTATAEEIIATSEDSTETTSASEPILDSSPQVPNAVSLETLILPTPILIDQQTVLSLTPSNSDVSPQQN